MLGADNARLQARLQETAEKLELATEAVAQLTESVNAQPPPPSQRVGSTQTATAACGEIGCQAVLPSPKELQLAASLHSLQAQFDESSRQRDEAQADAQRMRAAAMEAQEAAARAESKREAMESAGAALMDMAGGADDAASPTPAPQEPAVLAARRPDSSSVEESPDTQALAAELANTKWRLKDAEQAQEASEQRAAELAAETTRHQRLAEEAEARATSAESDVGRLKQEIADNNSELERLESRIRTLSKAGKKLNEAEVRVADLEREKATTAALLTRMARENKGLKEESTRAVASLAEAESVVSELKAELQTTAAERDSLQAQVRPDCSCHGAPCHTLTVHLTLRGTLQVERSGAEQHGRVAELEQLLEQERDARMAKIMDLQELRGKLKAAEAQLTSHSAPVRPSLRCVRMRAFTPCSPVQCTGWGR